METFLIRKKEWSQRPCFSVYLLIVLSFASWDKSVSILLSESYATWKKEVMWLKEIDKWWKKGNLRTLERCLNKSLPEFKSVMLTLNLRLFLSMKTLMAKCTLYTKVNFLYRSLNMELMEVNKSIKSTLRKESILEK